MEEIDQAEDQGKYTKRLWDDMGQKAKTKTIKDINGKGKDTQNSAKEILKKNYKKEEEQPLCPLCEIEEDKTEHVLRYGRDTDTKQRKSKIIQKKNGV